MAGLRFEIHLDGFIPEDLSGILVAGIKIPTAFATKIPAIRAEVQDIKAFVGNMNRKLGGQNLSLSATYQICRHDEIPVQPCGENYNI